MGMVSCPWACGIRCKANPILEGSVQEYEKQNLRGVSGLVESRAASGFVHLSNGTDARVRLFHKRPTSRHCREHGVFPSTWMIQAGA